MSFVDVAVTTDPDVLADDAVAYLQANVDGWQPVDGSAEMWLIEALARLTAEAARMCASVPAEVFKQFGAQLIGVTPRLGAAATITTTWTMQDAAGWTIPAGTLVAHRTSADTATLFEVVDDFTVPTGADNVGGVVLRAVDLGAAGNGVPVGPLEVIDALSYVDSVDATAGSSGGEDEESDADYLARLVAELRLMAPRPILAPDFAVLAQRVDGVGRALALNGYNPDDDTDNNERYVAVALVDGDGEPLSVPLKAAVVAYLDGLREANFVVKAMDPTHTNVNVTYQVHVATGFDSAAVLADVDASLAAWLSPGNWAGGDASPPTWRTGAVKVRYLQLTDVISNVPGVEYVAACTVNAGTVDVTLPGRAPLPRPGTITGTAA